MADDQPKTASRRPMRARTFWLIVAGLFFLLFLFVAVQSVRTPHPRIVVSEQTTRITGPLDKHGNVDYLAALNDLASEGVTPQNNAAVLFLEVDSALKPAERDRYLRLLGVKPPGEERDGLSDLFVFVAKRRGRELSVKEIHELDHSIEKPWRSRDVPLAAEWMAASDKQLDLLVEGTRRPKCYFPLVETWGSGMYSILLSGAQSTRTSARILKARAMQRIGEGNITGAEQDLLACHRMGRLVASTPFIIGGLIGMAIDSIAFEGDLRLLESGQVSAANALAYQSELRKLPPFLNGDPV